MKMLSTISVAIATGAILSGCGTYNSWTPRTGTSVEAYRERSCASGYYNCDFRGGSHDSNGNAHGSK